MTAKPCLGCGRLIATSADTCGFCGADQPSAAAALAKETRCSTCKRPYAAKLSACPFCARDRAAGVSPKAFGPTVSLSPPVFAAEAVEDDDGEPRSLVRVVAIFGVPLALLAAWGGWRASQTMLLGEGGPWRPSFVLALFVSPLLALAFVHRRYRTLSAAIDTAGARKTFMLAAVVTALAYAPTAAALAGVVDLVNGLGLDTHEEDVACTVGSIWQRRHGDKDLGWSVSYWCDVRGEHLTDKLERLPSRPTWSEGGTIHVRVARGKLGYWQRIGDPTVTAAPTAP